MLLLYCYYPRSVNLMTLSNAGLFSHTFVILQKLLVAKKRNFMLLPQAYQREFHG